MKAYWTALVVLLAFASTASVAQETTPVLEGFGGFSFNRTQFGSDMRNAPGFQFGVGYNAFRYLRLIGEVGGQYHDTRVFLFDRKVGTSNYQLLFGPELVLRNHSSITPFVHTLIGWTTRRYNVPTGLFTCTGFGTCSEERATIISDSGLALAGGGGFDVAIGPTFSVRPIQFDFIRTKMDRNSPDILIDPAVFPPLTSWQKNYRFATGLVIRFGERGSAASH